MSIKIAHDKEIHKKIQAGVDKLANAVKITFGPKGRNTVLHRPSVVPLITNEGAAIAREIELEDHFENMGAKIIKEVAEKTGTLTGDGSTAAIILAQSIIGEGFKNIAAGANPVELKKGIQGAAQLTVAALQRLSSPLDSHQTLAQVSSISANDRTIGDMIAEVLEKLGPDSVITAECAPTRETWLDLKEGLQFDRGVISPHMLTDSDNQTAELNHPYILITDQKISSAGDLLPLLEQIIKERRSLLIIADSVEGEALNLLVVNKLHGILNAIAVNPPAYGDGRRARLEDLAIMTGGILITKDMGHVLSEVTTDMLGSAALVKADRKQTVIIQGNGNPADIEIRKASIRSRILKTDYDFDKTQLKERLAKMSGGIAVIHAGADTEAEGNEKKQRIENALQAARSAIKEGIVPGGGIAYMNCRPAVAAYIKTLSGDRKTGAEIVLRALEAPLHCIAENAGMDGSTVIANVIQKPSGFGYDAISNTYVHMIKAGIVDSAKVTRLAVQNAASAASVLLTTEVGIAGRKGNEE